MLMWSALSEKRSSKYTTGTVRIWRVVAPTTGVACWASLPCWLAGKKNLNTQIAATARKTDSSMIAPVSLEIAGQLGHVSVCITQTMPRTNHPYWSSAIFLLRDQAKEDVREAIASSSLKPEASVCFKQKRSTTRTGSWHVWKTDCSKSHHLRGLLH